jgi:5-methylcytosine-specific restriction endonuclease McrA
MNTPARIESLQPSDRDDVTALLDVARRSARAAVSAEWQAVDLRDRSVLSAWSAARETQALNAEREVWQTLLSGAVTGRCQHGASSGNCPIGSCSYRIEKPSNDRYATAELRRSVLERDGSRCQYCGREVEDTLPDDHPAKAKFDHVIPFDKGGRTRVDNLVTACGACNTANGTSNAIRDSQGKVVGFVGNEEPWVKLDLEL